MKRSTLALLSVATLCLGACGSKHETNVAADAGNNVAASNAAAVAPSPGQAFANTAAASDAFEIATSRLALEKSSSAKVKKFAGQMVSAHTDSTAKLTTAAASASPTITPDNRLTPAQQAKLDALKAASGAGFDTAYIAEQRSAHEATLAALRDYSANGDVPTLKTFATNLVPIVTAHLNMAKSLKP